jgi:hypothetical protein
MSHGPGDHNPAFGMIRIIDNGGELLPDGKVVRQRAESDRDEKVTDDNPFPYC